MTRFITLNTIFLIFRIVIPSASGYSLDSTCMSCPRSGLSDITVQFRDGQFISRLETYRCSCLFLTSSQHCFPFVGLLDGSSTYRFLLNGCVLQNLCWVKIHLGWTSPKSYMCGCWKNYHAVTCMQPLTPSAHPNPVWIIAKPFTFVFYSTIFFASTLVYLIPTWILPVRKRQP